MNDEQRMELITILEDTYSGIHTPDMACGLIEDIIADAIESAVRMVE